MKAGWALLAVMALGLAAGTWAHPVLDEVQRLVSEGHRGRAQQLLDSLSVADLPTPQDIQHAAYLRGRLSEDVAESESYYKRYLQDEHVPQAAQAELRLGRLALVRKQYEEALEHFDRAIEAGRVEEGNLWKGISALILGQGGQAQDALSRAAESGSARIRQRAWMALGDMERRARRLSEALEYYDRVRRESEFGPGWWSSATLYAAECHEQLGEAGRAQDLYRELLQRAPHSYEAPLGRLRLKGGETLPAAVDTLGEGRVYSIQLGAFSLREHAVALVDSLAVLGFAADIVPGEEIHRVLVGGYSSREEAAAAGDSLNVILRSGYQVIEHDL